MPTPQAPGVQLRSWFFGRDPAVIVPGPGGTEGAEDLTPVMPLAGPISAGRPPVAPKFPESITIEPVTATSVNVCSGRRVTRSSAIAGGAFGDGGVGERVLWRVLIELEWGPMTFEQWQSLKAFLLAPDLVGLTESGALRAMTVDVDGEGVTDSAVDVRIVAADALQKLEWADAGLGGGVYRFGPVEAEEVQ